MFRLLQDFQQNWTEESEMTHKIMVALTNESLEQRVTPDGRSIGFLAWHIVQSLRDMMVQAGLPLDVPELSREVPSSAMDIAATFEHISRAVLDALLQHWNDGMLLEEVEMYGSKWTRGQTLLYLVLHQTHHRGQITVLMRQAGLRVPGTYGPSREEWALIGMPAMQ
jgi:uncharacterized damage-inducible protein DinB